MKSTTMVRAHRSIAALVLSMVAVLLSLALPQTVHATTTGPHKLVSVYNGRCMEVFGWYKFDGAAVNRWDCTGNTNQSWYFDNSTTDQADLRGGDSGKCIENLDVNYGVHIATCNGTAAQRWRFWPRAQGWALESLAHPGFCLHTSYGGDNGQALSVRACNADERKQWWEVRAPSDPWTIPDGTMYAASYGGKCMEIWGWSKEPGTGVNQWDCHGGTNQRWYIDRYTDDNEHISLIWNQNSGMCLVAGNPALGFVANQQRCTGLWAQRWYASGHYVSSGSTWYNFESQYYANSCLSLHLGTWNIASGAGVYTFGCTTGNQRSLQNWVPRP